MVRLLDGNTTLAEGTTHSDGTFAIGVDLSADMPLGPMVITAVFNGTDEYTPAATNGTYDVRARSGIRLDTEDVASIGRVFHITGRLTVDNGTGLDADLIVRIDGENYTVTAEDGDFHLGWRVPADRDLGALNFVVRYPGEGYVLPASAAGYVTVKAETFLNVTIPDTVVAGQTMTINGTLSDVNGPLPGIIDLWISVFDKVYKFSTDGTFDLALEVPYDQVPGHYAMVIEYVHVGYHGPANYTGVITVMRETSLQVSAGDGVRGEDLTFTGLFIDALRRPMSGRIELYWNDTHIGNATAVNGTWVFVYAIDIGDTFGVHSVTAVFPGSDLYVGSSGMAFVDVYVRTTTLCENATAYLERNLTVYGTLLDDRGDGIEGMTIDSSLFSDAELTTGANGTFALSRTVPSGIEVGEYSFGAVFPGHRYYLPSSNGSTVTIRSGTTLEVEIPKVVMVNDMLDITVGLRDDVGRPMAGPVVVSILDDDYRVDVDGTSTLSLVWTPDRPKGKVLVTVTYAGSTFHDPTSEEVDLTIKDRLTISVANVTAYWNSVITFPISVRDTNGPVTGVYMTIYYDNVSIARTQDYRYRRVPPVKTLGRHDVRVVSDEKHPIYVQSEANATVLLRAKTSLEIEAPKDLVAGETARVAVTVKDDRGIGSPLAGVTVIITAGNVSKQVTTNESGRAYAIVTFQPYNGTMTLRATFAGSEIYDPATAETTIGEISVGQERRADLLATIGMPVAF
ncbi:MAG TPA: hypothetical protein EYP43_01785, partial [Thermoplasmata archaeon]|nr:hypothetical protein [Thermoplasmata archaeon]